MRAGDAFFLDNHPSWSQADLDETDQDIVDYLTAIGREKARHAERQAQQATREAKAARHRQSLGGRRG